MISPLLLLLAVTPAQDACSFPKGKVLAEELSAALVLAGQGDHAAAVGHLAVALQEPLPFDQLVCAHFQLAISLRGLESGARQQGSKDDADGLHRRATTAVCRALQLAPDAVPPAALQPFVAEVRFGCAPTQGSPRFGLRIGMGLNYSEGTDGKPATALGNPYLFYGLHTRGFHFGAAIGTGGMVRQPGVGIVGSLGFGYRPLWTTHRWYRVFGITVLGGARWTTGDSDTRAFFFSLGIDAALPPIVKQD